MFLGDVLIITYLLPVEDIVVGPVLAHTEALVKSTVLVRLSEQPGCIHEVLACRSVSIQQTEESRLHLTLEIFCNLLIPQSDITLAVIDDRTKLRVPTEIRHKSLHPLYALNEVGDLLFVVLFIQSSGGVLDCLSENRRQPNPHGRMSKRILMVSSVRRPRWVVRVDLTFSSSEQREGELRIAGEGVL